MGGTWRGPLPRGLLRLFPLFGGMGVALGPEALIVRPTNSAILFDCCVVYEDDDDYCYDFIFHRLNEGVR